jgi:cytoskeletal protein RodZ
MFVEFEFLLCNKTSMSAALWLAALAVGLLTFFVWALFSMSPQSNANRANANSTAATTTSSSRAASSSSSASASSSTSSSSSSSRNSKSAVPQQTHAERKAQLLEQARKRFQEKQELKND